MSTRVRTIGIVGLVLAVATVGIVVLMRRGGDDVAASPKRTTTTTATSTSNTEEPAGPPPAEAVFVPPAKGPTANVPRGARKACGTSGVPGCRVTRTVKNSVLPAEPDIALLDTVASTDGFGEVDLKDAADPAVLTDGQTYFVFTTNIGSPKVPVYTIKAADMVPEREPPGLTITSTTTTTTPPPTPPAFPAGLTGPASTVAPTTSTVDAGTRPATIALQSLRPDRQFGASGEPTPQEAMPTLPEWMDPAYGILAPTVAKLDDGTYVMFFAARRPNPPDPKNRECIGRATSTAPQGPYVPDRGWFSCGADETGGALDPSLFRDRSGKLWLHAAFGGSENNLWVIPLDANANRAGPNKLLVPKQPTWGYWFVENPSMIATGADGDGPYLLAYSVGKWQEPAYKTGIAMCTTPAGPCRYQQAGPWLASNSGLTGPGGLSFFRSVDNRLRAAVHAYPGPVCETRCRSTYFVDVDLRRESIRLGR